MTFSIGAPTHDVIFTVEIILGTAAHVVIPVSSGEGGVGGQPAGLDRNDVDGEGLVVLGGMSMESR